MLDRDRDIMDDIDDDGEIDITQAELAQALIPPAHASTPLELARLGLSEIAYVRRAVVNDIPMWTIHSAAGDPLGAAQTFDQAWAAVKQNDLEPVQVH